MCQADKNIQQDTFQYKEDSFHADFLHSVLQGMEILHLRHNNFLGRIQILRTYVRQRFNEYQDITESMSY